MKFEEFYLKGQGHPAPNRDYAIHFVNVGLDKDDEVVFNCKLNYQACHAAVASGYSWGGRGNNRIKEFDRAYVITHAPFQCVAPDRLPIAKEYFRWMANDSPWADFFVEKDVDRMEKYGTVIDVLMDRMLLCACLQYIRIFNSDTFYNVGARYLDFVGGSDIKLNPHAALFFAALMDFKFTDSRDGSCYVYPERLMPQQQNVQVNGGYHMPWPTYAVSYGAGNMPPPEAWLAPLPWSEEKGKSYPTDGWEGGSQLYGNHLRRLTGDFRFNTELLNAAEEVVANDESYKWLWAGKGALEDLFKRVMPHERKQGGNKANRVVAQHRDWLNLMQGNGYGI